MLKELHSWLARPDQTRDVGKEMVLPVGLYNGAHRQGAAQSHMLRPLRAACLPVLPMAGNQGKSPQKRAPCVTSI